MAIIYGDQNPGDPNDSLVGTSDADEIYGLTGNDTIRGAGGADTLSGGAGDDVFLADGDDLVQGGEGYDILRISEYSVAENLILNEDASIEELHAEQIISGTEGDNLFDLTYVSVYRKGPIDAPPFEAVRILLAGGDDTFLGGSAANEADGGAGDDQLSGGGGADSLFGGEGVDTLDGGDGDDFLYGGGLYGGAGVDRIDGGGGDDAIFVDASAFAGSTISGGDGEDSFAFAGPSSETVLDNLSFAGLGIEKLRIHLEVYTDDYTIFGTDADNVFDLSDLKTAEPAFSLRGGDDLFVGAPDGAHTADGGKGDDTLRGGSGQDEFDGRQGSDVLNGGGGDDLLSGDGGRDVLKGGGGADRISGGAGKDTLTGGAGRDEFVFDAAPRAGSTDVITDYSVFKDQILLDHDVFQNVGLGPLAKDAFVEGAEAKDAQDRLIYDGRSGSLWFDLDGSGRGDAVKIATLGRNLDLDHRDFEVI